jgi:hypothetical protein
MAIVAIFAPWAPRQQLDDGRMPGIAAEDFTGGMVYP